MTARGIFPLACCNCGPPVQGCDVEGQFYDDFSVEQDNWDPIAYYADYVDQVNDRVDVTNFGANSFDTYDMYRCASTLEYREGWSVELQADVNASGSPFVAISGIRLTPNENVPRVFAEASLRTIGTSEYVWFAVNGPGIGFLSTYAITAGVTYELKMAMVEAGDPLGTVDFKFYLDDILKDTATRHVVIADTMIHGIVGSVDPTFGGNGWVDDYTFTLAVPAAGPAESPDDTVLFRQLLPTLSQTHIGRKTPTRSFVRFELPEMSA